MTMGWTCPNCGQVYSPTVMTCWYCPRYIVATGTSYACTCRTSARCPLHSSTEVLP